MKLLKIGKSVSHGILALLSCTAMLSSVAQGEEQEPWVEGYLKVGYGFKYKASPYWDKDSGGSLFISGRYQVKPGFFIEIAHGANELDQGTNIGFNFYNTDTWSFDLLTVRGHGENAYHFGNNETTFLIEKRKSTNMLGIRTTGAFGRSTVQFTIAPYTLNKQYDNALYASLWGSHSWQVKNWQVNAALGAEYRSAGMLDYYYSTTPAMEQIGIPKYQASSGIDIVSQLGVSYPISENVLFESYARYKLITNSITDFPPMKIAANLDSRQQHETEFGILVSYVF
ncbi:MipA/OmpV family protein [Thalassotalea ganghwensis]